MDATTFPHVLTGKAEERVQPTYLERALQNTNGELWGRLSGQPKSEIWMRLAQLLQFLLQLAQPSPQQVAILQHQPLAATDGSLQQL